MRANVGEVFKTRFSTSSSGLLSASCSSTSSFCPGVLELPQTRMIVQTLPSFLFDLHREGIVLHQPVTARHEHVVLFHRRERRTIEDDQQILGETLQPDFLAGEKWGLDVALRLPVDGEDHALFVPVGIGTPGLEGENAGDELAALHRDRVISAGFTSSRFVAVEPGEEAAHRFCLLTAGFLVVAAFVEAHRQRWLRQTADRFFGAEATAAKDVGDACEVVLVELHQRAMTDHALVSASPFGNSGIRRP